MSQRVYTYWLLSPFSANIRDHWVFIKDTEILHIDDSLLRRKVGPCLIKGRGQVAIFTHQHKDISSNDRKCSMRKEPLYEYKST